MITLHTVWLGTCSRGNIQDWMEETVCGWTFGTLNVKATCLLWRSSQSHMVYWGASPWWNSSPVQVIAFRTAGRLSPHPAASSSLLPAHVSVVSGVTVSEQYMFSVCFSRSSTCLVPPVPSGRPGQVYRVGIGMQEVERVLQTHGNPVFIHGKAKTFSLMKTIAIIIKSYSIDNKERQR